MATINSCRYTIDETSQFREIGSLAVVPFHPWDSLVARVVLWRDGAERAKCMTLNINQADESH